MKRLSSKKALEALEFLCKKKLGAVKCKCGISSIYCWKGQDLSIVQDGDLFEVAANVEFDDGKGCICILEVKSTYGSGCRHLTMHFTKTRRLSWASILKILIDYANNYKYTFGFGSLHIISPGDTIEKIFVEMELADGCI